MTEAPMNWKSIATAPIDGSRVRVGHELDPSSMRDSKYFNTTGAFVKGKWQCSSGFTCADKMLRWTPTHWLAP